MSYKILSLFLVIQILSIIKSDRYDSLIKQIYNYNTTAAIISLDNLKSTNYVYFTFDLSDFLENIKDEKENYIYFKIFTESSFYYYQIKYMFLNKKADKVSYNDVVSNNGNYFFWNQLNSNNFIREQAYKGYDNYIKIKINDKQRTLVIRINIWNLKGEILAENVEALPNNLNIIIKKSDDYYRNHTHIINNEHRYYNNNIHDRYYHYHKEWRYHSHDRIYQLQPLYLVSGIILGNIWILLFILYCMVNRRKRDNTYFVQINNGLP